MKISKEEIIHVANLARLEIDDQSIDQFAEQIDQIFEYINTINKLDTTNVTPTSNAIFLTNVFREDKVKEHLSIEDALTNAPEKEDEQFLVPRVI
jgi:aspartyl-tRNA(Asn)/glutamyl-tRNA(Gln) amidotransferase subunit C